MSENELTVSVITVCLNSESSIEQTIQSVIGQTYPDIEYIIIDGGSTDGTLSIIEKYRDSIAVLVSEKDQGVYDAMNKGIKLAQGEIIGIINSDDWYEPDAVETMARVFLQDRSAQVCYGNMNVYDKDTFLRTRYPSPLKDLRTRMAIPHPSVFIRSEIYKQYRFNTKYKIGADYDLLLKLYSMQCKFRYVDRTIVNFRLGGFSESSPFTRSIQGAQISLHYRASAMDVFRIILRFLAKMTSITRSQVRRLIAQFS